MTEASGSMKRVVHVRDAELGDCATILGFIKGLAAYEKLSEEVLATEDLIRESLFGSAPRAACLIAELDTRAVGFALYFRNYSTFLGRHGFFLEDLFVLPEERGRGVGRALLARLAERAVDEGAGRLEWSVLDWNTPAQRFYDSLGAVPMTGWTDNRLTGGPLRRLARSARGVTVSMVVASSLNGAIGRDGELPWRLSADLKRFKSITTGKPIIMGRKTFDSIGKPLPGRMNIVVTRSPSFDADGVTVANDPVEALRIAERHYEIDAVEGVEKEICVIGGAQLYETLMDDVDVLRLTIVDATIDGDAFMPVVPVVEWRGEIVGEVSPDAKNDQRAWFVDLYRNTNAR
ncbi:MAG: dihydrofolate reductase [Pseudomonadota bacterium]